LAQRHTRAGLWLAGSALAATFVALVVLLAGLGGTALAATGGAGTPASKGPPPGSKVGAPDPAPSVGELRLVSAATTPRKSFFYGVRNPRLRYSIASSEPANDLRIDVVDEAGEIVKSFYRNDVPPNVGDSVQWDGTISGQRSAPNGRYRFQIVPQDESPAAMQSLSRSIQEAKRQASSSAQSFVLNFSLYGYAFPILGAHDFGSSGARFGAGRAGHTHQGQDVMAECGTPLVAARGGRVRYSGWDGAAGNYLVIDGRGTGLDMAYMHMLEPSPLEEGMTVRTGQPIGVVGSTGSSTACHLHFEIWTAPGWYEGGAPVDPLSYLLRWDAYS
jgi:murein DD-endopeptidase MepM/ murein hydrolase activator NlpD